MSFQTKLALLRPIMIVALAAVTSCATSNTGLVHPPAYLSPDVSDLAENRDDSLEIIAIATADFNRMGLPRRCFYQETGSDENWRYVYFLLPADETALRNCEVAFGRRLSGLKYAFSVEGELVRRTWLRSHAAANVR